MTVERFDEKVAELAQRCPTSPYLPDLRRGYSVANVVYIQLAFKELGSLAVVSSIGKRDSREGGTGSSVSTTLLATSEENADVDNIPSDIAAFGDAVLLDFDDTRRELYRRLYATRKRFFDFPFSDKHNDDRAEVSADVQRLQRQIAELKKAIERYVETGELPQNGKNTEGSSEDIFVLPTDPFKLIKTQGNLRSSLSRIEREIRQLAGMQADQKRIDGKEKTRLQLLVRLQQVKEAVEKG
jgi:hypothetical protein